MPKLKKTLDHIRGEERVREMQRIPLVLPTGKAIT